MLRKIGKGKRTIYSARVRKIPEVSRTFEKALPNVLTSTHSHSFRHLMRRNGCERHELSYQCSSSGISCNSDGVAVLTVSEGSLVTDWGTTSRRLTICSISVPASLASCLEARTVSLSAI